MASGRCTTRNLIADVTKPLAAEKVKQLNALAGICLMPERWEPDPEEPKEKEARFSVKAVRASFYMDMEKVVKMMALLGVLQKAKVVVASNAASSPRSRCRCIPL